MLLNFVQTANLTHTLIWAYDEHTKDVMTGIERMVDESGVQAPFSLDGSGRGAKILFRREGAP
jgi:hypothetical protein